MRWPVSCSVILFAKITKKTKRHQTSLIADKLPRAMLTTNIIYTQPTESTHFYNFYIHAKFCLFSLALAIDRGSSARTNGVQLASLKKVQFVRKKKRNRPKISLLRIQIKKKRKRQISN